jgi:threonine dehydrogenase-like Zn-dependent dehydrogenase
MRDGSLRVADLITDRVTPGNAPAAYAALFDHPAEHLGVVINWRNT